MHSTFRRQLGLTNDFKVMSHAKRSIYQHWQIDDLKDVSHFLIIAKAWLLMHFQESAVVSRSALEHWLSQGLDKSIQKLEVPQPDLDGIETAQGGSSLRRSPPDIVGQPERTTNGLDSKESMHQSDSPDPLCFLPLSNKVSSAGIHLDNSSIACEHGALDPQKANEMKRIKMVYILLFA